MNVSLTPCLEEFTKKKVESGLYNNASEVIREALRLMYLRDQNAEALHQCVTRGFEQIERGECEDVSSEAEFLELARRCR
jgi:antitoxin ParD1/3/4